MIIYINGTPLTLKSSCSLKELIEQKAPQHAAVALNNQFIPKPLLPNIFLNEGDKIDLIIPMQGG